MSFDAQSLIVDGVMLLAAGWLIRSAWRTFAARQAGGCGSGCSSGGCATKTTSGQTAPQVFTLSPPK